MWLRSETHFLEPSSVIVAHATHGIEIGTSKVWDYAEEFGLSKVVVINGMDAENAQHEPILEELANTFGKRFFPINIPVNAGPEFNEALDVIRKSKLTYKTDGSGEYDESPATGDDASAGCATSLTATPSLTRSRSGSRTLILTRPRT